MRRFFTLLLILTTAGCGGGPDVETLKQGVGERLAGALPAGTVSIAAFVRRGSQADVKAPAGETRRIVYFDADLKLERDFDFGAWDAPGVSAIVSALGTGPKGLIGINSGGNKAGDIVRAHGTALYEHDGHGWVAVASGGYQPTAAPAYATNAPQGAAAILEEMRRVIDAVPGDAASAQRAVIAEELQAAYATIRARLVRAAQGYAIAAGPEHGQYLRFAQALADNERARMVPLITRGGEENLRLLREGKVSLALAQGDAALQLYEGKGSFAAEGPYPALRAIGSLYPEPLHILVHGESDVASVADLKGRRVVVGQRDSASRTTALRALEAQGLGSTDIMPVELALGDALVALQHKEVDAVIQVIGVPADSIREALAKIPLRLIPLSERAVAALVDAKAGYFAFTIPKGAYANQAQDVRTIATAALLLAAGLSDSEVGAVTRFVFEKGRDFAARGSAQGTQVSIASARQDLTIPLHIAAGEALDSMVPAAASVR